MLLPHLSRQNIVYIAILSFPQPSFLYTVIWSPANRRYKHTSLYSGDYKHHHRRFHSSALPFRGLQGANATTAKQLETKLKPPRRTAINSRSKLAALGRMGSGCEMDSLLELIEALRAWTVTFTMKISVLLQDDIYKFERVYNICRLLILAHDVHVLESCFLPRLGD
jgi:hypothetical protein